MCHKGLLAKLEQLGVTRQLLELFSTYLHDRNLRIVVSSCPSAMFLVEASVPQVLILGHLQRNILFNDLHCLPVASAYADDCTLSHSYIREEVAKVIDARNCQLCDIVAWGSRW